MKEGKNKKKDGSRSIRISCGQLSTEIAGPSFKKKQQNNLREILAMIKVAGERGSDLILFGEYANLHHRSVSQNRKEYVPDPIPGTFTNAVASAAKKCRINVAIPMFGLWQRKLSSYVVLMNRNGKITACYQKTHPTISEQDLGIIPGNDQRVFKLDFACVGIMTCMDIEYPEVAQVLMLRGAELLLFPHVGSGWGEVDWEIRYRARAIDTGLPLVSASFGYTQGKWTPGKILGRSGVIGRDGGILADIGREIGVITCDLDLEQKRVTDFFFSEQLDRTLAVSASRRPELYGDLANMELREDALRRVRAARKRKN
ncbi:MAG: carbon-nitrogen hydrolase family protein [Ignavibacteriales bacterium]|nr:carbon-nitrogen hydrolase family protein [Ignavibacteriales bacterium]